MQEKGKFSLYEKKEYNLKETSIYNTEDTKRHYSIIDIGTFISSINYNQQAERASVNTGIFVRRFTKGINYGGTSVRDNLFTKLNHSDCFEHLCLDEYFVLLSNGNILHYSDNSDLFEIYETNMKSLKNGIENVSNSKIYNSNNKDFLESNEEVHKIIATKKKVLHK